MGHSKRLLYLILAFHHQLLTGSAQQLMLCLSQHHIQRHHFKAWHSFFPEEFFTRQQFHIINLHRPHIYSFMLQRYNASRITPNKTTAFSNDIEVFCLKTSFTVTPNALSICALGVNPFFVWRKSKLQRLGPFCYFIGQQTGKLHIVGGKFFF